MRAHYNTTDSSAVLFLVRKGPLGNDCNHGGRNDWENLLLLATTGLPFRPLDLSRHERLGACARDRDMQGWGTVGRTSFPKTLVARAIRNAIRANRPSRESFASETPIFIAHHADSHESLELPIRANRVIRANCANRFARITPLSLRLFPG